MTTDSIGSCSSSNDSTTLDALKQRFQDFQDLNKAVGSGDLSSAQTALTAYQQDIQDASPTSRLGKLFADGTQGSKDLQALNDAIKNNDTTGAQTAMAALKTDLKGTQKAHHGHHHKQVDNDSGTKTPTTGSTTTTDGTASTGSTSSVLDLLA